MFDVHLFEGITEHLHIAYDGSLVINIASDVSDDDGQEVQVVDDGTWRGHNVAAGVHRSYPFDEPPDVVLV